MQSTAIAEGYDKIAKQATFEKPSAKEFMEYLELDNKEKIIELLTKEMNKAAANLDFEHAAELRDKLWELQQNI